MDLRAVAGVLSGVGSVASTVPYVVATARRSIQPNPLAWGGWALLNVIVLVAQMTSEPSWSAVIAGTGAFVCVIIVVVTVRASGVRRIAPAELACGTLGIAAVIGWQVTSDPQVALGFAIAASQVMAIPMVVKTVRDPFSEPAALFVVFMVVSSLSVLSAKRLDFLSVGWPASYLAFDVAMATITIRARAARAQYRLARSQDVP